MKTRSIAALITLLGGLLIAPKLLAQSAMLNLELTRDWGYGGFNDDIQGAFTLKATGPADITKIEFYIDTKKIGEATRAPFAIQFITDDYPTGMHTLSAKGTTTSGAALASRPLTARFIAAADATRNMLGFVVPILVIVFGAIVLAAIVPLLAGRKGRALPLGAHRQYPMGGGICPRCGSPVAFQLFGMNLLGAKLQRCPACGKWGVIRPAALDKLRAAEQAELAGGHAQIPVMSDADKLKKDLDDSKYQDV